MYSALGASVEIRFSGDLWHVDLESGWSGRRIGWAVVGHRELNAPDLAEMNAVLSPEAGRLSSEYRQAVSDACRA